MRVTSFSTLSRRSLIFSTVFCNEAIVEPTSTYGGAYSFGLAPNNLLNILNYNI
jgi:hypothetical protein